MKTSKRTIGILAATVITIALAATAVLPAIAAGEAPAFNGLAPAAPAVKFAPASAAPAAMVAPAAKSAAAVAEPVATYTGKKAVAKKATPKKKVSDAVLARRILAGLIKKHPILAGTTVTIGQTPGGYQAVAYYTSGRIVINPRHRASLSRILNHEVWHVIDWRDNGQIDWYENVPPRS